MKIISPLSEHAQNVVDKLNEHGMVMITGPDGVGKVGLMNELWQKLRTDDGTLGGVVDADKVHDEVPPSEKTIELIKKKFGIEGDLQRSISTIRLTTMLSMIKRNPKLIMIQYPEIYLHISTQKDLHDYLFELSNGRNSDPVKIILLTHSPAIVSGMWNYTYCLGCA